MRIFLRFFGLNAYDRRDMLDLFFIGFCLPALIFGLCHLFIWAHRCDAAAILEAAR
jgi:hypothetical protein